MSDVTYIHTSSQTSNLNHVAVSSNLNANTVNSIFDYQLSDHFPINCSKGVSSSVFQNSPLARDSPAEWYRRDWSNIEQTRFLESIILELFTSCKKLHSDM